MTYYAALDDGYIRKSIRDGSVAVFEEKEDAEKACNKLKCEMIEVVVLRKENHDRLTEENAKLRGFIEKQVPFLNSVSAQKAQQLLNQLKEQQND